jgi:hypothetical protein
MNAGTHTSRLGALGGWTLAAALAIVVLGMLVLASLSHAAAETGTFQFQQTETDRIDLSGTCLGATGTITRADTVVGRFTEHRPPAFGFHDHGTATSIVRVELADGRYILGSLVAHFDDNATQTSQFTSTEVTLGDGNGTLYAPDGQPLGPTTIHAVVHLAWGDANGNFQPDPDEITASVNDLRLTCP